MPKTPPLHGPASDTPVLHAPPLSDPTRPCLGPRPLPPAPPLARAPPRVQLSSERDLTPQPRAPGPTPDSAGCRRSPRLPLPQTPHLHAVDVHFQLQLLHRLAGFRDLGHVVGHGCDWQGVKSRWEWGRRGQARGVWGPGEGGGVVGPSNWGAGGRAREGAQRRSEGQEDRESGEMKSRSDGDREAGGGRDRGRQQGAQMQG